MAPVATEIQTDQQGANGTAKAAVKPANGTSKIATQLFNPFYSPTNGTEGDDSDYKYAKYKVRRFQVSARLFASLRRFDLWIDAVDTY